MVTEQYRPANKSKSSLVKSVNNSDIISLGRTERTLDKLHTLFDIPQAKECTKQICNSSHWMAVLYEVYLAAHTNKLLYGYTEFYFSGVTLAEKLGITPQTARRLVRILLEKNLLTKTKAAWHDYTGTGKNSAAKYTITKDNWQNLVELLEPVWNMSVPDIRSQMTEEEYVEWCFAVDDLNPAPIVVEVPQPAACGGTTVTEGNPTPIIKKNPTFDLSKLINVPLIYYIHILINNTIQIYSNIPMYNQYCSGLSPPKSKSTVLLQTYSNFIIFITRKMSDDKIRSSKNFTESYVDNSKSP